MANTVIQLKWSDVTSAPITLTSGEAAYSNTTQKLFIGDSSGNVLTIGGKYFTDQQPQIFTKANGAFDAANSAGSYANSAFSAANTASGAASAGTYANGAFTAANSAGSYANSAFGFANTTYSNYAYPAYIQAGSAAAYANSAFAAANAATATDATQNTNITNAGSYANAAFLQANTPSYVANSAASYANSGFATANSASIYANGAFTSANSKAATASPTFTGTVVMANANTTVINVQNQLAVFGMAYQNIVTLTDATTITMNLAQTNNFTVTLGGNRTLANATNFVAGQSGFLVVRQDGTGSRTLSFGTGWRFPSNTAPTLTTTASAVDLIAFTARDSGNLVAQAILSVT